MRFFTTVMVMFIILFCTWTGGTCMNSAGDRQLFGHSQVFASPGEAAGGEAGISPQSLEAPKNWALRWAFFLGVFGTIWLIFYKGVYIRLVKYYYYDYADSLFWSLTLLYSIGWISFSLYAIFEVWQMWPWARFVSLFISALWFIWFLTVIFRSDVGHKY